MELLNLALPKKTYLLDFLSDRKAEIEDSWFLMHNSIVDQLLENDGYRLKRGINNLYILYRSKDNILEEIIIDDMPFPNWSAVIEIRTCKNGEFKTQYDSHKMAEANYFIRLKMGV